MKRYKMFATIGFIIVAIAFIISLFAADANATFFSFFDLGVGVGAMAFGQIGHWLGYSSIYIASAISVSISIILYIFIARRTVRN